MPIPEAQLEIWSNRGAVATAQQTRESLRHALSLHTWPSEASYETYLQGSYRNYTNIRSDSDVDLVVELNSAFRHDLSSLLPSERSAFQISYADATYRWEDFRADVLQALRRHYGYSAVKEGKKTLKVESAPGRLPADVVVALEYRRYRSFSSLLIQQYVEGMTFWVPSEARWAVNFPKVHYQNGNIKQAATSERFRSTVRMFKNARRYLVERGVIVRSLAPSYMVECFIYNADNTQFFDTRQSTYLGVIGSLVKKDFSTMLCQNEQLPLFGSSPEQWNVSDAIAFLRALLNLWDNWGQ
jgi:hypothetical protein